MSSDFCPFLESDRGFFRQSEPHLFSWGTSKVMIVQKGSPHRYSHLFHCNSHVLRVNDAKMARDIAIGAVKSVPLLGID
jgi:hypothetical protein